jgi:predicted nucleotidyltransferase
LKPIEDRQDTIRVRRDITFMVDGVEHQMHLDILGFEMRKTIQKLTSSDLTYHELLDSSRLLGADSDALDDLANVAAYYANHNTLFQVCLDLAKRNLYIGGINRKGDTVTSKSLILGLRFTLMAQTLSSPGTLECRLDNLCTFNSIRFPWTKKTFEWLSANRDMTSDHLLADPRTMQIIQLYHATTELPHPKGKRNHDMTFANEHYRRIVQGTLGTYHITNAKDLIAGVF